MRISCQRGGKEVGDEQNMYYAYHRTKSKIVKGPCFNYFKVTKCSVGVNFKQNCC